MLSTSFIILGNILLSTWGKYIIYVAVCECKSLFVKFRISWISDREKQLTLIT